jgi:hypothetical protein
MKNKKIKKIIRSRRLNTILGVAAGYPLVVLALGDVINRPTVLSKRTPSDRPSLLTSLWATATIRAR